MDKQATWQKQKTMKWISSNWIPIDTCYSRLSNLKITILVLYLQGFSARNGRNFQRARNLRLFFGSFSVKYGGKWRPFVRMRIPDSRKDGSRCYDNHYGSRPFDGNVHLQTTL